MKRFLEICATFFWSLVALGYTHLLSVYVMEPRGIYFNWASAYGSAALALPAVLGLIFTFQYIDERCG